MLHKKYTTKLLFFRESSFKIAELIFNHPNRSFHIRELAKETGLSTTAVVSSIRDLDDSKIIRLEKTDLTTNVIADLDSESYRSYKKIFNLYRLEGHSVIRTLIDAFHAETIVLFGSFARGEDIENSDIDLLILTNSKEKQDIAALLGKYEQGLNRKINLHILPALDKSSKEFKNAVANGIVLHGYLKVI